MFSVTPKIQELARKIAEAEKSDIYLYNGPVNENGVSGVLKAYARTNDTAILILTTNGGSANAAYRIARFFQTGYDKFGVLVFSYCKSAGTLIATGAHRLIMSPLAAELGPLDVQLNKRDELWERRSGLMLRSALTSLAERTEKLFMDLMMGIKAGTGTVRLKLASDLAVQMTTGLFTPIYQQITPEGLGEDYQELMVAFEYGKRLASVGKNIGEYQINSLVHNYPSHDFVIDALEAKTLFTTVDPPTADMFELAGQLHASAYVPDPDTASVFYLSKPEEQKADEGKEKGAPDATAKVSNGNDSAGSSDASTA